MDVTRDKGQLQIGKCIQLDTRYKELTKKTSRYHRIPHEISSQLISVTFSGGMKTIIHVL